MSNFKHSTPALFLLVFVVLEQSESDVLVPICKVPVLTRPQPVQVRMSLEALVCTGSVQEQS